MNIQMDEQGALCPACERFIGPATSCPYCGTDSLHRPAQRFMRVAAVVLALLGMTALYLAAVKGDRAVVDINRITPTMQYHQARVIGTVTGDPYISRKHGRVEYLSFSVDDGTDSLRVSAYRRTARALLEAGLVPGKGDRVDVSGRLSVPPDGRVRLNLQVASQLRGVDGVE